MPTKYFDAIILDNVAEDKAVNSALAALRPGGRLIAVARGKTPEAFGKFLPLCNKAAVGKDLSLLTAPISFDLWRRLNGGGIFSVRSAWHDFLQTGGKANLKDTAALDDFIRKAAAFERLATAQHGIFHGDDIGVAVNRLKESLIDLRLGFGEIREAATAWKLLCAAMNDEEV